MGLCGGAPGCAVTRTRSWQLLQKVAKVADEEVAQLVDGSLSAGSFPFDQ
jgi:hypothetical protein